MLLKPMLGWIAVVCADKVQDFVVFEEPAGVESHCAFNIWATY